MSVPKWLWEYVYLNIEKYLIPSREINNKFTIPVELDIDTFKFRGDKLVDLRAHFYNVQLEVSRQVYKKLYTYLKWSKLENLIKDGLLVVCNTNHDGQTYMGPLKCRHDRKLRGFQLSIPDWFRSEIYNFDKLTPIESNPEPTSSTSQNIIPMSMDDLLSAYPELSWVQSCLLEDKYSDWVNLYCNVEELGQ